ncbi:MAG: hypothetical protein OIF57_06205 [Marinobacterium sp.]|nr:hypothetical protein [Marinobacterium sp.]
MSSSDKDLNIPNLGPAQRDPDLSPAKTAPTPEPEPVVSASAPAAVAKVEPQVIVKKGGMGVFTGGLLVMALGACGGMGYWLMELETQFRGRSAELTDARYQIGELRELLQSAESSALESGKSVISQVDDMAKEAGNRYRQYDAALEQLQAAARAENPVLVKQAGLINGQAAQLKQQSELLKEQDEQLTDLVALVGAQQALLDEQAVALQAQRSRLEQAEKQLEQMLSQAANVERAVRFVTELKISQDKLGAAQVSQGQDTAKLLAQLQRSLQQTRSELSTQTGILNEQLAEQSDQISVLSATAGKTPGADPALQRRVAINEDAIRAFDGTRRQLNRDLLQIRKRLNNLQLKVEQR